MEEQKLLKKKSKAAGNKTALVSVCTDLAAHYSSVGQYSKAIEEYEILCNIYKEEKKMILYAQANRGIGEAYMGLHDFDKSLKYFKIYYDVATRENNTLEQQRALAQLGHMYLTWYLETLSENNRKLLDEAYGYFLRSMKKCESLSDSLEKQDMLARLFSNLGLVKENLGEYETALSLYEKSIKICLKNDIYEQLYRGYLSMASLFDKQEMHQETIKNYNLAIEIAKKISSKRVELICAALLAKSDTLIKIADFQGAKQVLRKAYKFKTPNKEERKDIEKYLRVVAGMCKVEDEIITCCDQKKLKHLYEKMGDGACDLKNYTKAIEYYKKMLEEAEKSGVSDKELGECYYSLGETYKDNGSFKEAEIFFEKEYNLCKDNLKDSLTTLYKIADLKEMAHDSVDAIKAVYERGLSSCKKKHNLKEEKRVVIRYLDFLRRSYCQRDASKLEHYLNNLDDQMVDDDNGSSSSSDVESEDSAKVHLGDDIVLSDVTDVSEESDNEVPEETSVQLSKRRKQNAIKFKKNLNGEWPLHVACIKGSLKMVQYWLDVDHPVNVRDNAGWLPLHEAAVHGHLEIVRLLLDHKASINDRGGSACNGVTPLHDAASNGHLEVIELLLDRGASAVAKTDDGNTPLFELKKWRRRIEDLNDDMLTLYNKLIKRLEDALEKAGQKDMHKDSNVLFDTPEKGNVCSSSAKMRTLRRNFHLEETPKEDPEDETPDNYENLSQESFQSEKRASNEYQIVMQTLRHKNYSTQKTQRQSNSKRSALIDEDDFVDGDDWLEDDIRPTKNKKRKRDSLDLFWGATRSSGSGGGSRKSPAKSAKTNDGPGQECLDFPQDLLIQEFDENSFENTSNQRRGSNDSSGSNRSSLSRKRSQITLLDSGFSRERTKSHLKRNSSENAPSTSQTNITSVPKTYNAVEADSTTISRRLSNSIEATQTVTDPVLFVDVEIESKVFRVPVLMSQLNSRTIKWLAKEAAHRYERKEFMKPVLELETISGVILADSDLLSLLFPMGSLQAEKVVGKVTEWSLPSVLERYEETCANMGVDCDSNLCKLVENLSIHLNLSDCGILGNRLIPLLKAINNQKPLTEINLSGNFLNVQSMNALCTSIITLPQLRTLNLSCTGLQRCYLAQLASTINANKTSLSCLMNLDISDNIQLKNDCFKDLSVITLELNLKMLNLSNIGLKNQSTCHDILCLKCVEHFDVSYNELTDGDLKKIVTWLDGSVVKNMNVSRNMGRNFLRNILDVFENQLNVLESIDLEECGVNDSNLFELLRLAPNITSINLASNPDLTSISLRRLLEQGNLSNINVTFCDRIWAYFDPAEEGWTVEMAPKLGKAVFKISGNCKSYFLAVVEMFRKRYEGRLEVDVCSTGVSIVVNFS